MTGGADVLAGHGVVRAGGRIDLAALRPFPRDDRCPSIAAIMPARPEARR